MAPYTKQSLFEQESDGEGVPAPTFKVNEEYASRFEHNKKREELHRLGEKFKHDKPRNNGDDESDDDDYESDSETEDDDAFLATEQADTEMNAVLSAIKNKDPRLKDRNYNWYKSLDDPDTAPAPKPKEDKPVRLRDYHRMNLLNMASTEQDEPKTYVQEQADIKNSIAEEVARHEEESDDGEEFFQAKKKKEKKVAVVVVEEEEGSAKVSAAPAGENEGGMHPSRAAKMSKKETKKEVLPNPDQDPEGFLMQYATSRSWVGEASKGPKWQAFDSDQDEDESEDERMEQIEHAFNMRFEDPEKSNEIIRTFARADRSVRRDKPTTRQSKREKEREEKAAEKKERQEERARLRRLKIEENEEKLRKVRQAAGMSGKAVADDDLMKLLEDAWDDDKWEDTMKKRFFNETYYAEQDPGTVEGGEDANEEEGGEEKKKKKPKKLKKPKWDDDIDIKDLVPDFEDEEKLVLSLSDSDDEEEDGGVPLNAGSGVEARRQESVDDDDDNDDDEEEEASGPQKLKNNRARKRERQEARGRARKERARVEALVDSKMMTMDPAAAGPTTSSSSTSKFPSSSSGFRYRETSPGTFGLTARDILLAPSDEALNDFAGLKKHATWRDEDKKRRDRKKLGKKARLRQWRKEVYGEEFSQTGPTFGFERLISAAGAGDVREEDGGGGGEDGRNKRRRESEQQQQQQRGAKREEGGKKRKKAEDEGDAAAAAAAPDGEEKPPIEREVKKRRRRQKKASK